MSAQRKYKRVEDLEGEQLRAASATANAVVAAGAGSGKTMVLAARYVRLIETGRLRSGARVGCRNILVLTFTRKAAAEMYGRIYGALAESALLATAAEDAEGRELADHLTSCLADFSAAQISTFDSFASRIARSGSARFGIAPDFGIDEESARRKASELALSFVIEHREEEAMRDLVSALGLEGARDDVLAELALRRMSISSPPDFEAFHAAQASRLEELTASAREGILAMRAAVLEYAGVKTTDTSRRWIDAMSAEPGEGEDDFPAFLDGLSGLRKPSSNSKDDASLFLSDSVEGIRKAIEAYRNLAATRAAHPGRLPLYRRLDDFRRQWDAARRAAKILTFRDVAQLALDTLAADPEVRRYYQELYRYAMIDEFQDDDELQKRILYLLAARPDYEGGAPGPGDLEPSTLHREPSVHDLEPSALHREPSVRDLEPDKLFFVGDEKQSIYLFRGADVSVFRSLAAELGGAAGAGSAARGSVELGHAASSELAARGSVSLGLTRNYRSEPGVIDMINEIFPSVMASADPERGHESFEARFEKLEARKPTEGLRPIFAYLELPRGEGARRDEPGDSTALASGGDLPRASLRSAAECEAWEVARLIRDWVESEGPLVADRDAGMARPARYEDFAVLLRSTGNQVHFEKYFRLFGLPYASENACGLFSEAVACDLYYALRVALYPEDRNAFSAYFRSPFAGLSDEAVVRLLMAATSGGDAGADAPGARRPSAFSPEAAEILPEAERGGFARGLETRTRLASMVDRASIAACLRYLWFEAGYRASLLRDPVASAFEEHFELMHSLAVAADDAGRCLASFVAELELLVGKPDKLEVDLPRESASGVRIMTVHKSKGLEFPVVVVPQANNAGQDRAAREAWYWEEKLGPTFKPPRSIGEKSRNAFFEASKERRSATEAAEIKRLLYVALTRAESHIVVTATEPYRADSSGRSFRSLLGRSLGLFDPPSPLGGGTSAEGADRLSLAPFGELVPLPSGALVGRIPERGDLEYFCLVEAAASPHAGRERGGAAALTMPPLVKERRVSPVSSTVTAAAELYARRDAMEGDRDEGPEALSIAPDLAAPRGLSHETWGSLVHALLEARLAMTPKEPRLPAKLRTDIEEATGGEEASREAIGRAARLAEVFLGSELGRRALASPERYVELPVAIGPGGTVASNALRYLKGSIDLAFAEGEAMVVVDYKTDQAIEAGRHDLQVAAYGRAAEAIFGRRAETWVFYLYGGGIALPATEGGGIPLI